MTWISERGGWSVPAEAAWWNDRLKFAEIQIADRAQCLRGRTILQTLRQAIQPRRILDLCLHKACDVVGPAPGATAMIGRTVRANERLTGCARGAVTRLAFSVGHGGFTDWFSWHTSTPNRYVTIPGPGSGEDRLATAYSLNGTDGIRSVASLCPTCLRGARRWPSWVFAYVSGTNLTRVLKAQDSKRYCPNCLRPQLPHHVVQRLLPDRLSRLTPGPNRARSRSLRGGRRGGASCGPVDLITRHDCPGNTCHLVG
jgi:hypothetical protein